MADKQIFGTSVDDISTIELKLLSSAIIQTGDHIIVTDKMGLMVYINPAFMSFTGYTFDDLYQKKLSVLKSGQHPTSFYRELWETILSGETFRAVFINRKKNGELYHEEKTITPIQHDNGEITHFISVGRDITNRLILENHVRALELEKERINIQEEFMGSVSHDFRTPLTSMQLHLHLLEQDIGYDAYKPRFDILKAQLFYLNRVTENMLTIFRLKEGIVSTFASMDINYIIQDIMARVRFLFDQKNIVVNCDYVCNSPPLFGNEVLFMRAMSNLIENALYYTPQGGAVDIHTDVVDNQVIVQICDTGVGIKPEHLPHIFEQFYKPDETYAQHGLGMGLGLRIVKRIVEMHNGTIQVDSEINEGTVFTVFLPIHKMISIDDELDL